MKVVVGLDELQKVRGELPQPVGLVPTMGFLHTGHLSLVKQARQECASVVVSIFVNPTQFSPTEDLGKYPRDLPRDLELVEREGAEVVWTPREEVMYPDGFQTWVSVEEITNKLEGTMRPTHFRGVATVVSKLFNAVQPQKAYFGQKDAQQAAVIRRMVRDLNFPIEIIVCPTVREPDGLAMSSRNVYLSEEERKVAVILSQALFEAKAAFAAGERGAENLRKIVQDRIATQPLVVLQYVSCADPETLEELNGQIERGLISLAAKVGKTRLIDNVVLGRKL